MNMSQDNSQPQLPSFQGYRTIKWLGSGGFSNVYLVEKENSSGSLYAVKQIKPEVIDKNPVVYKERFKREILLQMGLHQPYQYSHIVKIYHYDEQQVYLVMDYASGGTLEKLLDDEFPGGMDLQTALNIIEQIGSALAYMHEKTDQQRGGIVHLDLKPRNILINLEHSLNGEVKRSYLVADFSMAHELLPTGEPKGGSSLFDGTARYMAPEQAAQGRYGSPGPSADIYALGVVLYQMLSGKLPQPGVQPLPLRELKENIPLEVERVVQKATANNPDDRYRSMRGFVNDFRAAVNGAKPPPGLSPEPGPLALQPGSRGSKFGLTGGERLTKALSRYYSVVVTAILLGIVVWSLAQSLPLTHFTQLGGLDLGPYCKSLHYDRNVGDTACASIINLDHACNWQHQTSGLHFQLTNPDDPTTGNCYDSKKNAVGGISNMGGYCQQPGLYYGVPMAVLEKNTTWECEQNIDVTLACIWQYSRGDVQARKDGTLWHCYGFL